MAQTTKFLHRWLWIILPVFFVTGVIASMMGVAALICMVAPVAMAFFRGRFWCGYFCPRGSFSDIFLAKFSRRKNIPQLFKKKWFKLVVLIVLMGAFSMQLILAWGDLGAVGLVFLRMVFITTILAAVLGIIYHYRAWCVICPMGTLAHFVSAMEPVKARIKHITFNAENCVSCKICSKDCPVGIDLLKFKEEGKVLSADCLKCRLCMEKCPKKSLYVA